MADFALWAAACETALWRPIGTFACAHDANRPAAQSRASSRPIHWQREYAKIIERRTWTGSASDLLRAGAGDGDDC
jgi:hypothetical protein